MRYAMHLVGDYSPDGRNAMGATIQGYGGSQLSCEADQIVIRLPRKVFGTEWKGLVVWLLEVVGFQQVISNPQRVMTERGGGEDAPRWKQLCIDVLSWLLFLLKVPANRELVALWQAVPWAVINGGGSSSLAAGLGGVSGQFRNIFDPHVAYTFGITVTIGLMAGPIGDQQH